MVSEGTVFSSEDDESEDRDEEKADPSKVVEVSVETWGWFSSHGVGVIIPQPIRWAVNRRLPNYRKPIIHLQVTRFLEVAFWT